MPRDLPRSVQIHQAVARACGWLNAPAELCVFMMMVHMLADVLVRVFLGVGLEGMVESVTYLYMVGLAFLPVAALEARSAHLRVEILVDRVPMRSARVLHFFSSATTALVASIMAWLTFDKAWAAWLIRDHVELTRWSLPTWPAQWVFPLGFALLALAASVNAFTGPAVHASHRPKREAHESSQDAISL